MKWSQRHKDGHWRWDCHHDDEFKWKWRWDEFCMMRSNKNRSKVRKGSSLCRAEIILRCIRFRSIAVSYQVLEVDCWTDKEIFRYNTVDWTLQVIVLDTIACYYQTLILLLSPIWSYLRIMLIDQSIPFTIPTNGTRIWGEFSCHSCPPSHHTLYKNLIEVQLRNCWRQRRWGWRQ